MTISEAHATVRVIQHLNGVRVLTDQQLTDELEYLADRAGKVLQVKVSA